MDREPGDREATECLRRGGQRMTVEAMSLHRGLSLDEDPGAARGGGCQGFDVRDTAHGMDDAGAVWHIGQEWSPRAEHHDIAAESRQHVRDLLIRADRNSVCLLYTSPSPRDRTRS